MAFLLSVTVLFGILLCLSCSKDPGENIIVTDIAPCWKGKSHTLTCKLKELRSVVEWMNENDHKPILHCSKEESSCELNPAYDEKYDFSYNFDQNTYNLTIKNVTEDDNGKKFLCSDGSYSGCEVLNVEDTKPDVHEDTENRIITVTTARTPQERNVSFKWIKIDAKKQQEIEFRPKIVNTTVTNCSNKCEYQLHVRRTYTFYAEPNGNERMNYIVVIDYGLGNEPVESLISTSQKIIEYQEVEDRSSEHPTMTYLLVSLIVLATIVVSAVLIVIYRRYKLFNDLRKADCWRERHGEVESPLLDTGPLPVIDLEAEPHLTGLMISWKSQSTSKQSGFIVTYQEMPAGELVNLPDVVSVENQTDYSITIPDLFPEVTYKVNVQALQNVSGKSVGSPLQEIIGTTDKKINEEGSADQEKVKGPLETRKDYKDSNDECTDPNSNDNHGNDSIDMKGNYGVVYDKETLPKLYLVEEDDEDDDDDGIKDMETLDGIIEGYNAPENIVDEVLYASLKAEEAKAAAAGIKSIDEQMYSLLSLSKISGKDTCAAQIFEEKSASEDLNIISDKAIPSCNIPHVLSKEPSLPKPNISMTFLTRRSTEDESKGSGSVESTPLSVNSALTAMSPWDSNKASIIEQTPGSLTKNRCHITIDHMSNNVKRTQVNKDRHSILAHQTIFYENCIV